ncbi:hypothetical protein B0H67DRAFT_498621, partial [Lasiosphaeris hirsuta]
NRYILLITKILFIFYFSKIMKLISLFRKNLYNIFYLLISIFFSYFYSFIKLYILFTLNKI